MRGGRFRRGWALAGKSWAVLRSHRSLMLFQVLWALTALVVGGAVVGSGVGIYFAGEQEEWILVVFGIIAFYVFTFVGVFFATALAAACAQALRGEPATLGSGIAVASKRLHAVLGWSLVQGTVGLAIQALEALIHNDLVAQIIQSILAFAWSIATFFVIPSIALEGLGPFAAIKRSVQLLRQRWGEGLAGGARVGVVGLMFFLPAIALGVIGFMIAPDQRVAGIGLIAIAVAVFVLGAIVVGALGAVFRVALYEYATGERAVGPFEADELQSAFVQRRGRFAGI